MQDKAASRRRPGLRRSLIASAIGALPWISTAPLAAEPEAALPEVVVSGTREGEYRATQSSAGALGERSLQDTPFSVGVVTKEWIQNTQATQLSDIFKADPSVATANNAYNGEASLITVRGMQVDLLNGTKYDGLSVANWGSDIPLEHFEQVELLKGLGGFMYGFAQPGGTVNYVLKRPTAEPLLNASVGYSSQATVLANLDAGGRFGDRQQFGYRTDIAYEGGDTYVEDGGHIERGSAHAAFDWRITPDLVWSIDGLWQNRRTDVAYYGVLLGQVYGVGQADIPDSIDGSRRLASPHTYYETQYLIGGTSLNWAFANDWNFSLAYRQSQQDRINYDSAILLLDNQGTYMEMQWAGPQRYETRTAQAMVEGKLRTGEIEHQLVGGISYDQLKQKYAGFSDPQGSAVLGIGNLDDLGEFTDPHLQPDDSLPLYDKTEQTALFLSDTLKFNPQWSAILGLRYTRYDQKVVYNDGPRYTESPLTPTLAVIYKPVQSLSLYGSYVEGLEKGGSAPQGSNNYGETYGPLRSRQIEVGAKLEQRDYSASAALFRVERGYEYTNASGYFVQDGKKIYQGLELNANARVARDWNLIGGLLFLDPHAAEAEPDVDGKRLPGAARFIGTAYAEYAVPGVQGLVLSGGGRYVSKRAFEANNEHFVDAYYTLDIGARYTTRLAGKQTVLRLNIDNLTNQKYWSPSWDGFILTQGAPLTVKANATMSF
ncbi:TonB-dependent receptor [Niveibacterium sp. SC-1]|uniref:TonB-dependent siderophore receptor n=1 Tax=Niveibacterium sp. SC-1 TaxID=3135646 RepID=UPI00311D6227